MTKAMPCKCRAGSKPGKPAKCENPTKHKSGYCASCRHSCWSLQRHNLDHSKPTAKERVRN